MASTAVPIFLDKNRFLKFRHNDLADLEVASGKGVSELMQGMSFHGIRLLLCYGLRHQDGKMTPVRAGQLVDAWLEAGGSLESLMDKILGGLRASGFLESESVVSERTDEAGDGEGNARPGATTDQPS